MTCFLWHEDEPPSQLPLHVHARAHTYIYVAGKMLNAAETVYEDSLVQPPRKLHVILGILQPLTTRHRHYLLPHTLVLYYLLLQPTFHIPHKS